MSIILERNKIRRTPGDGSERYRWPRKKRLVRCYSCRCFANCYTSATTRGRFRVDVDNITLVCDTRMKHHSQF